MYSSSLTRTRVSYRGGDAGTGIPPSPQKFENYDVIITSTATNQVYKTQLKKVQHNYRLSVLQLNQMLIWPEFT